MQAEQTDFHPACSYYSVGLNECPGACVLIVFSKSNFLMCVLSLSTVSSNFSKPSFNDSS